MSDMNVYIPYADFVNLQQDSGKLNSVLAILGTKFPDDTCQLIAIKSVLGIIEEPAEEEEPIIPDEPIEIPDPEPEPEEP